MIENRYQFSLTSQARRVCSGSEIEFQFQGGPRTPAARPQRGPAPGPPGPGHPPRLRGVPPPPDEKRKAHPHEVRGPDMDRRRLRQLSCPAKDAVLCTSFDRDELLRIAAATGVEPDSPEGLDPSSACAVQRAVHEACRSENPFSLRLEEILDGVHEETLRDVAEWGPDRVGSILHHDLSRLGPVLPGLLWAVATQSGPRLPSRRDLPALAGPDGGPARPGLRQGRGRGRMNPPPPPGPGTCWVSAHEVSRTPAEKRPGSAGTALANISPGDPP